MRGRVLRGAVILAGVVFPSEVLGQVDGDPSTAWQVVGLFYDLSQYRAGRGFGGALELEGRRGGKWLRAASIGLNVGLPGARDDVQPTDVFEGQPVSVEGEGLELVGPGVRVWGAYRWVRETGWAAVGPEVGAILCLTESTGVGGRLRPVAGLRWHVELIGVGVFGRAGVLRVPMRWVRGGTVARSFGDWRRIAEVGIAFTR